MPGLTLASLGIPPMMLAAAARSMPDLAQTWTTAANAPTDLGLARLVAVARRPVRPYF